MAGAVDGDVGFEELYAQAGADLEAIPWASLTPHPALREWLDRAPTGRGQTALVVGCGYGDDAEELGRRGFRVVAFDIAPSAIARCRERFPYSTVDYLVADLFALSRDWLSAFDLAVEIRTLQSLPLDQRADAARAIAGVVRAGGRLFVRCLGRGDDEGVSARPWPVSRGELNAFADSGLAELEFREEQSPRGLGRSFTVVYGRD